jgi:hypothetical protein
MATPDGSTAASVSSEEQAHYPPQQGNLESVLTHYEHARDNAINNNPTEYSSAQQQTSQQPQASAPLTIDIPSGLHPGGGVEKEEDRDRSLTMGSEFDQFFAHVGKDGRGMSISGLLTPLGDAMSEGTSSTAISGSTSSTYNSTGMHHSHGAAASQSHLPRLPENDTSSSGDVVMSMDATPITSNYTTVSSRAIPVGGARGRGESHGSAAMFLNGIYNNNNQKQHQPISHTPPSHLGTSYENSHFGKRMRAGVSL